MSITMFDMSDVEEKKASDSSVPKPLTSFNDNLSIGVLATELLERMAQRKIPSHPLQTSVYMRPEKTQAITHAILDLTGFPMSISRAAHGLSLPTANDITIAKTFISAASLAFVAAINNSDVIQDTPPILGIHSAWICATAKGAIDSARNLIGLPTPPTQPDDAIPNKGFISAIGGALFGRRTADLSFV